MDSTVFDLDEMLTQSPSAHPKRGRNVFAVVAVACVLGAAALLGVFLWRSPHRDAALFHRAYVLPAPNPIQPPALPLPVVTTTPPPIPQVVQLPAPRPSLGEIGAGLRRGLGEWELPHYVNAPQYGSGPNSPAPSQLKPHVATVPAE